jgi:hypothetical protein
MTRGVPDTTARYDRSVYVAKLQSDGEPAYEPAMNRIRPSRVLVLLLRTHTRRKTLQSALQVLQVLPSHPEDPQTCPTRPHARNELFYSSKRSL